MSAKISRRQFFKLRPGDLASLILEPRRDGASTEEKRYFRPPGALRNEEEFLSTCHRCRECSAACPYDVIQHLSPVEGVREGTPVIDPNANPCRWCPSMDCIRACPSGALSFGTGETVAPVGKAVLNPGTCLTAEGILCDRCAVTCPSDVKAITMRNRQPHLDDDRCVGCGLCVLYCESDPVSLKIMPISAAIEAQ